MRPMPEPLDDRWRDYSPEDLGQEVARLVTDMARSRDATVDELRRRNEHLERELETQLEVAAKRRRLEDERNE